MSQALHVVSIDVKVLHTPLKDLSIVLSVLAKLLGPKTVPCGTSYNMVYACDTDTRWLHGALPIHDLGGNSIQSSASSITPKR